MFEEYGVTWELDLRKVIWVCETEGKLERCTTIKKVCVKSAWDATHSLDWKGLKKSLGESALGQSAGKRKS